MLGPDPHGLVLLELREPHDVVRVVDEAAVVLADRLARVPPREERLDLGLGLGLGIRLRPLVADLDLVLGPEVLDRQRPGALLDGVALRLRLPCRHEAGVGEVVLPHEREQQHGVAALVPRPRDRVPGHVEGPFAGPVDLLGPGPAHVGDQLVHEVVPHLLEADAARGLVPRLLPEELEGDVHEEVVEHGAALDRLLEGRGDLGRIPRRARVPQVLEEHPLPLRELLAGGLGDAYERRRLERGRPREERLEVGVGDLALPVEVLDLLLLPLRGPDERDFRHLYLLTIPGAGRLSAATASLSPSPSIPVSVS